MEPLCLPATLESLEEIGNYVIAASTQAGLETKATYGLRLAVDEIATNIITHGYEEAGITGDIKLSGALTDLSLTILLEDSGVPFDPLAKASPSAEDLALPLEDRPIGGLGIFLVQKGVDVFRYEFVDGCNRNIFVMNRTGNN